MAERLISEYEGGGVMPNTVHPKGSDALTASEKLRLQSLTGQETDSRAPVDYHHWYGNVAPEPAEPGPTDAELFNDPTRYLETDS